MFRKLNALVFTNLVARKPASRTHNKTHNLFLALLVAGLATISLWVSSERVHSAPLNLVNAPTVSQTPIPEVKLEDVPGEALIGEQFKFKVTFDNVGPVVGYAPFIDIVLPAGGKDLDSFNPSSTVHGPCDGISTIVNAIMVNVNGGPLPVTTYKSMTAPCGTVGGTVTHPYSGSGVLPILVPPGGQLLTLELPFGSFEPDQPKIEIEITVDLHNYADVGPANKLTIYARGGFRFGATELNDFGTDPPILTDGGTPVSDSLTWLERKDVIPTVFTVAKSYLGPEGEAVSGPNFVGYYPLKYQVTVNVAAGQTVTQLTLNDCLENNMTFLGLVAPTTPGYTGLVTSPCLQMTYASITGTNSTADVVVTYEFYINKFANGTKEPVLDPKGCSNTTSTNKASASGFWMPLDPRDTGVPVQVSGGAKYVLADKHIAIQKSVAVKIDKKGTLVDKNDLPIPGDYLEYTLKFQVSDFFTFGEIEIVDLVSDGQLVIQTGPAKPASLRVTDRFGTSQGDFTSSDLDIQKSDEECKGVKGGTRVVFNVSKAMMNLSPGLTRHNQGIMTGGHAMTPSSPIAAEGEITFYVQIQDEFLYQGDDKEKKYVDKHDPMNNCVNIFGRIYENTDDKETSPIDDKDTRCSDDSGTSVMIKPDVLRKEIIARNGKTKTLSGSPPKFAAGDTITFSISKTIPSGDWENLTVRDWAPLPVLDTNSLSFPSTIPSCGGAFPTAGQVCLGPNDNVGQPGTMTHNADNSFTFDYGTQNNPLNTPKTIEIWFTLTLTNKPFADGLYFTNEAQECEFNTFGKKFCQVAVAQFVLTEPSLRITKGVVWAPPNPDTISDPNATPEFSPSTVGPVPFSGPLASCGTRFTGTINSANLAIAPINSDLSNVDAGDRVLYAIVVENRGSGLHGAFDVKINDTLPAGFVAVPGSLCVSYGTPSAPIGWTISQPNFFTSVGIELTDQSATMGALEPYDSTSASPGRNIAVITFYADIVKDITANCYLNTARLLHYAASEQGPDFVAAGLTPPFEDSAQVCILPKVEKCISTTSESHTQADNSTTGVPQPPQVTIGEIIRYRLKVKLPEGTSPGFYITDDLPPGMTYMNDGTTKVTFVSNNGIASNLLVFSGSVLNPKFFKTGCPGTSSAFVLPASQISGGAFTPGVDPKFSFGTLTNYDFDPGSEFVIVEFNALVNNLPNNTTGALPNRDGEIIKNHFSVTTKGAPTVTSADTNALIVEPKLDVQKTFTPIGSNGLSTFSVSMTNVGHSTAFDVTMTDPLPTGLVLFPIPVPTVVASPAGCAQANVTGTGNGVSMSSSSIPVNCTITANFPVSVCSHCVTNKADVAYTSLPGLGTPANSPGNNTGSTTPCSPTNEYCERQYTASAQASITDGCPANVGSLTVIKKITSQGSLVPPSTATFPITVSCSPSGPNTTFTLTAASPTQTVNNIPVNSTCTVTEGPLPPPFGNPVCASLQWATPTYTPGQTVTIPSGGGSQTVTVNNYFFCNTAPSCATPPPNMVAWWQLNETSGTIASDIMGGNTGQTMNPSGVVTPIGGGGPMSLAGQYVGNSLSFINQYVQVPNAASLNFGTGEFSIDAWVRPNPNGTSNSTTRIQAIVDKTEPIPGIPLVRGYALFISHPANSTAGKLGFVIDDGTTPPASIMPIYHTAPLTAAWFHVAVTVARTSAASATVTLYVNGVASVPMTIAVGSTSNVSPLWIGKSRLQILLQSDFREGAVDEVEIFKRAITASEVQQIFNAGTLGKCKTTIKGMKFNDINGNGTREISDVGLANWTITATDSNNNTQTTTTDSFGNYSFTVAAPGTYTVSEVLQTGWIQTAPSTGSYSVTVAANQIVGGREFGNRSVQNQCDLKIEKVVKPNPLVYGQQATAIITIQNVGTIPCHGPQQVAESMPAGLSLLSANVTGGTCTLINGTCVYGSVVPVGGSVVFTYLFNVTAQPGTSFENCSTVKNSEDKNTTNDSKCVALTVGGTKPPNTNIRK